MTRSVDVELRSSRGAFVERIEASITATDSAIVDMARRQAGVSPEEFKRDEVLVP